MVFGLLYMHHIKERFPDTLLNKNIAQHNTVWPHISGRSTITGPSRTANSRQGGHPSRSMTGFGTHVGVVAYCYLRSYNR